MFPNLALWERLLLSAAVAFAISYMMTPPVKRFAEAVGAMDIPKDERRVHNHPIPRMGGLAIFLGFVLSLLLFVEMSSQVMGLLLGTIVIAVMGALDDIVSLNAWIKLAGQLLAAGIAVRFGIVVDAISNFSLTGGTTFLNTGWLSIPVTVLWIVACTNAVNLIDGLDGLAVGVSAISSLTMLVVSLYVADPAVSLILAAVLGACVGFMPYNLNPAKIFMGDVGSQMLGFVLSTASIMGLFKFHAIISFLVPLLALAVPLADTMFAFFRRIIHGQSPFHADKGHFHHRLMALGMSQKQAVAVLYGVSAVLGLIAVLMTGQSGAVRIGCIIAAFVISIAVWLLVLRSLPDHEKEKDKADKDGASGNNTEE